MGDIRASKRETAKVSVPSFEEFFETEFKIVFRAIWLITGNRYEAEEIVQDAFYRTWERWDRISTAENPTGYVYRAAVNIYRSRYRKAIRTAKLATHLIPSDGGLGAIEDRDSAARLLSSLSEQERAVLVLTDVLMFTTEETAAVLKRKPSTVRAQRSRAHARLRLSIGGSDG